MATSKYSAAEIGVLWDLDYCPIPVGLTPESVSQNIKLALKNMGYTGAVSISAYSLTKQTKEDFESARIRLCYSGAGEIVEIEDIKHIAEEKDLMGERMEKLKEEWDSQSHKKCMIFTLFCLTCLRRRISLERLVHTSHAG